MTHRMQADLYRLREHLTVLCGSRTCQAEDGGSDSGDRPSGCLCEVHDEPGKIQRGVVGPDHVLVRPFPHAPGKHDSGAVSKESECLCPAAVRTENESLI